MRQRTRGRHPLRTSDALGAAASQVGPDAQAAAATLHTRMGLSHGKVAAVLDALFGIALTRGASAQINLRAATRLEPDYHLILDEVKQSATIAADETGWQIGGHPAWLHVWVGDRVTAYAVDSQRSAAVLERVIGTDWSGILSHDGYASYDRFEAAVHQQRAAHVLRRARDLLATATRGAVRFPRQVIALFTEATHWRNAPGGPGWQWRSSPLCCSPRSSRRSRGEVRFEPLNRASRPRSPAFGVTIARARFTLLA